MNVLTCAAARRRLEAYYDGELTYGEQIDVNGHLEWCEACGALLDDLRVMRGWLRSSPRTSLVSQADHDSLNAMVLSRIRAERTASWSARGRAMFEDMHFVYAGLGAGMATVACITVMLSMTRFATTSERSPGSNQNPVVVAARLMPRPLGQMLMTVGDEGDDDGAFTMSAVVTREGRVVNLELHSAAGKMLGRDSTEARALEGLLGSVAAARFEPAKVSGLPVAVNMVWMIAHTTVRATKLPAINLAVSPAGRKRRV
ncbi:MAG: anti-sigma factor [Vicinamibacterales bacterium]